MIRRLRLPILAPLALALSLALSGCTSFEVEGDGALTEKSVHERRAQLADYRPANLADPRSA